MSFAGPSRISGAPLAGGASRGRAMGGPASRNQFRGSGNTSSPTTMPGRVLSQHWPKEPDTESARSALQIALTHAGVQGLDEMFPYPVVLSSGMLNQIKVVHEALARGIEAVVENYFKDDAIRNTLRLPLNVQSLLKQLDGRPYQIGAINPRYLIDSDGRLRINSIKSSCVLNGIGASFVANKALPRQHYLNGECRGMAATNEIPDWFGEFDPRHPLFIVTNGDTSAFAKLMGTRGVKTLAVRPRDLDLRQGMLVVGTTPVNQVIVDLDPHDILNLSHDARLALLKVAKQRNDFRSIFLADDPRLLAVLSDTDIMARYLSNADIGALASGVVPTFVLSRLPRHLWQQVLAREGWLIKGPSGPTVRGDAVSAEVWRQTLINPNRAEDVMQARVREGRFPVAGESAGRIKGSLLCFDHDVTPGLMAVKVVDRVEILLPTEA